MPTNRVVYLLQSNRGRSFVSARQGSLLMTHITFRLKFSKAS